MTMNHQPINVEYAARLANTYLRSGRLAEAETIYRQILAVNHKHFEALHALGVIAMNVGKFGSAEELIGAAIQQYPFNCAAHNNLGISLMRQGKLNEAIQSFKNSLSIKQDYTNAMYNLARTHQELGDHGAGLEMMLKARGFARFTIGKVLLLSPTQGGRREDDDQPKTA